MLELALAQKHQARQLLIPLYHNCFSVPSRTTAARQSLPGSASPPPFSLSSHVLPRPAAYMIRPRWLALSKAVPLARWQAGAPARLLSSNSSSSFPGPNRSGNGSDDGKKHLNDMGSPPRLRPEQEVDIAPWWKLQRPTTDRLLPHERQSREAVARDLTRRTGQHQLIVRGVNPNLLASDFSRIAAQDLSEWQSAITEISQERDPWTFEPLGNFIITFDSNDAATVYQAKLDRLFRLAQHKARSQSGLWANTAPDNLRGHDSPEDELAAFTIAPETMGGVMDTKITRVSGRWPWQHLASQLIVRSGYTLDPALVLLHMHHSSLTTADMQAFIKTDGELRNEPWAVKSLYNLSNTLKDGEALFKLNKRSAPAEDPAFRKKLRNRFVLVCRSPNVAWRFIRSWNQRVLTREVEGKTLRTVLTASYIEV